MTLKEMLGHATLNQVLVYAHLPPSVLAADMAKIKLQHGLTYGVLDLTNDRVSSCKDLAPSKRAAIQSP